jgi:preprotein translocase subunit Sec61beta
MAQNKINLPGGFGGLMRYDEEYSSMFNLKPSYIVVFVVLIIIFRVVLGMVFN